MYAAFLSISLCKCYGYGLWAPLWLDVTTGSSMRTFLDHTLDLLHWLNQTAHISEERRRVQEMTGHWDIFVDLVDQETDMSEEFWREETRSEERNETQTR